jgi:hypothetical protein
MSTNTTQPDDDEEDSQPDRPVGRRFVSDEVADIERELLKDGVALPNRGIPSQYESRVASCADADELRQLIETETAKEHPNQSLIGFVNDRLAEVTHWDGDSDEDGELAGGEK